MSYKYDTNLVFLLAARVPGTEKNGRERQTAPFVSDGTD